MVVNKNTDGNIDIVYEKGDFVKVKNEENKWGEVIEVDGDDKIKKLTIKFDKGHIEEYSSNVIPVCSSGDELTEEEIMNKGNISEMGNIPHIYKHIIKFNDFN